MIFGIIAAVLLVAVIAYAVYKVFIEKPDYLDDFEDEFEDDYEDGFDEEDDFEDEEE